MQNLESWVTVEIEDAPEDREDCLHHVGGRRTGARWIVMVPETELDVWELDHLLHTLETEGATVRGLTPALRAAS